MKQQQNNNIIANKLLEFTTTRIIHEQISVILSSVILQILKFNSDLQGSENLFQNCFHY